MSDIQIEVLGSAGAVPTPRVGCPCHICAEALEKGPPYSRCGPSYFVHGPNVLIDTPEEIRLQLTRSKITNIAACFYSHWHPDHTMGRRVFECNFDFASGMSVLRTTPVYLPEGVAEDFKKIPGLWDHFAYLEKRKLVDLIILRDGESVEIAQTKISPIRLAEPNCYAFLFETKEGGRALIAPDELRGFTPPDSLGKLDVAIIQTGLMERNPISGARRLPEGFLDSINEMNFEECLELVQKLRATHTYLSHLEEPEGLDYQGLCELEKVLQEQGHRVSFAYDLQKIPLENSCQS